MPGYEAFQWKNDVTKVKMMWRHPSAFAGFCFPAAWPRWGGSELLRTCLAKLQWTGLSFGCPTSPSSAPLLEHMEFGLHVGAAPT